MSTAATAAAEPPVEPSVVPMAPTRTIFMRCTENRVEDEADGGLLILQGIAGQPTDDYRDARVVLSFTHDEPMRAYPVTRDEKRVRVFEVTVTETTRDAVPVMPSVPSAVPAAPAVAP
jgi:hypothetical protein